MSSATVRLQPQGGSSVRATKRSLIVGASIRWLEVSESLCVAHCQEYFEGYSKSHSRCWKKNHLQDIMEGGGDLVGGLTKHSHSRAARLAKSMFLP